MKWHIAIFIFSFLSINIIYAQEDNKNSINKYNFYFRINSHLLDSEYLGNNETIRNINKILDKQNLTKNINSINIVSSASPDGNCEYNKWLANKRGIATKGYLVWKHPHLNKDIIKTTNIGENWEGLKELVENDDNVPYKDKVLQIIQEKINPETKEWKLTRVGNGSAWKYIKKNYLHNLRSCTVCLIFYNINNDSSKQSDTNYTHITPDNISLIDTNIIDSTTKQPDIFAEVISPDYYYKPLFAIKTNLLYDLVTALNVELEVPIGKTISVNAEWIFPWWKSMNAEFTMQLLNGNGAVKYWLGNRDNNILLTGWYVGITGGGGKYDFQFFNKKGYQGEFFTMGMQGGYAHSIGNNFRMEYSIGAGYINSCYEKYSQVNNTEYGDIKVVKYPWKKEKLHFFGPTALKISLVWLIKSKNYYKNKGER